MPIISIIVPVYNSSKHLHKCLDSILNQTFTDFEVILIDDGSTDNSGVIVDEYACKDGRIIVFHQANSGQAAARNLGVIESKGEWLCFIDSDDVVNPYYLEYLHKAVANNNVKMSVCDYIEDKYINNSFFDMYNYSATKYDVNEKYMITLEQQHSNAYWLIWGKLIKRDIVLSNMFKEGKIYEDNAVAPKWLYYAKSVAVVDLPLYFYTKNDNGTTRSDFSIKQLDLLWALEEQLAFLDEISYSVMKTKILLLYMNCTDAILKKMRAKTNLRKQCSKVKKQAQKTVRKYSVSLNLNVDEKKRINSFLHPFLNRVKNKLHIRL